MFNFFHSKFHVKSYSCRPKQDVLFEDEVVNKTVRISRGQPPFVCTHAIKSVVISLPPWRCNTDDFTTKPQTKSPVELYRHGGSNWLNDIAQRLIFVENKTPTGMQQHRDPAWNLSWCSGGILVLEISRIFSLFGAHTKKTMLSLSDHDDDCNIGNVAPKADPYRRTKQKQNCPKVLVLFLSRQKLVPYRRHHKIKTAGQFCRAQHHNLSPTEATYAFVACF